VGCLKRLRLRLRVKQLRGIVSEQSSPRNRFLNAQTNGESSQCHSPRVGVVQTAVLNFKQQRSG